MSLTTTSGNRLTRGQSAQMPALLEFYSPSAALLEVRTRGAARGVIWTVASMFVACAAASAMIPIDMVVSATAKVVATQDTIVIQPLETAIVRDVAVQEGQIVHKGDLLARLDPTFTSSDKTALALSVASLQAEVERRQAEDAAVDYRPSANNSASQLQMAIFNQRKAERTYRLENYSQKIDSLQGTLARAIGDAKAYGERLKVASTVESKRRELSQLGWGSQLNELTAQDTRLDIERSMVGAQQTAKSAANDLQAMRAEAAAYDQNWKSQNSSDMTDAQRKLDQAKGDSAKADKRSELVEIRATGDATVLTRAPISNGSVLQSGDQLLKLVPVGAPVEIEGSVLGSDAGYVHVGDTVTVKFDTLPFTHYGSAKGTVRVVSPDSFTPSGQAPDTVTHGSMDLTSSAQAPAPGQAYYKVKITLDELNLHDTPPGFKIVPGMPITADILVGKRTVLTYMFSRALPVALDGMREP